MRDSTSRAGNSRKRPWCRTLCVTSRDWRGRIVGAEDFTFARAAELMESGAAFVVEPVGEAGVAAGAEDSWPIAAIRPDALAFFSPEQPLELGAGEHHPTKGGLWFEEGGDEAAREALGLPDTGKERMKWALNDANKEKFVFEYGKTYGLDFFNPYLDFANLALRLPGFQLSIANYWDGQALR